MPFIVSHPPDTAERQEGEPFYSLARYTHDKDSDFSFDIRSFRVLPPCDAVSLLNGGDETGLIVWAGALGMVEWLLCEPQRLAEALSPADSGRAMRRAMRVVELGSGSGVLAVALCKLLSPLVSAKSGNLSTELLVTDGNAACVALSARNLREQCGCGGEEEAKGNGGLRWRTACLQWGDSRSIAEAVGEGPVDGTLVVSADVIYDATAVPLLVETVAELHTLSRNSCGEEAVRTTWWLAYTPRSLTRASNLAIYAALVEALSARPKWRVKQFPLPAGCFDSGFRRAEAADVAEEEGYALLGCVFVVNIG